MVYGDAWGDIEDLGGVRVVVFVVHLAVDEGLAATLAIGAAPTEEGLAAQPGRGVRTMEGVLAVAGVALVDSAIVGEVLHVAAGGLGVELGIIDGDLAKAEPATA